MTIPTLFTKLKTIFAEELVPIDLPTDGQRVVYQGHTISGGYPMTLLENPDLVAYTRYRKSHGSRLRATNHQLTQYPEEMTA